MNLLFVEQSPRTEKISILCIANAAPMLVTELSYPTYRGPLTSLFNCLWYSGSIMQVSFCSV